MPRNSATAVAVAVTLLLAACGDDDPRPAASEWRPTWQTTRDLVPSATTIAEEGEDVCGDLLGELRASREELLPSPRPVIDDSVSDWLAAAEGIALDCPDAEDDLAERLDDLEVLGAEVDAGLTVTESS